MISDALFYLRATIGAKELAKRRFRVKAKKGLAAFLASRGFAHDVIRRIVGHGDED